MSFAGDQFILAALSIVVFIVGGRPFLHGFAREVGARQLGRMTLISLAIVSAMSYSLAVVVGLPGEAYFWETATLIDVMLIGQSIEIHSVMCASGALEALVQRLPNIAHRLAADGTVEDVKPTKLAPGDRVMIRPGERVPIDGEIVEGISTLDESMLTGETRPIERGPASHIIGGSVNGEGTLVIKIDRKDGKTYLAQAVDLVRRAQASRSHIQDLANDAAAWLTWIALGVGLTTFIIWLVLGESFAFALERMVTVMVISCPHALGLAVPLVVVVSTGLAARNGILIRDRVAFERVRHLDAVVFDKTGTLTEGRLCVVAVVSLNGCSENEILALAAALESRSEHPIARGITRAAKGRALALPLTSAFRHITGQGEEAQVGGSTIRVVSPSYLLSQSIIVSDRRIDALAADGRIVVFVLAEHRPIGVLALADIVREESAPAVRALKSLGIRCMMLTGDARPVADAVARELEIDEVFAEVLPHQMAETIAGVRSRGLTVAMVGDGVNDAPALVEADLGIVIGAGSDVAVEAADVVVVRNDPRDVAAIVGLARATYRKMVENLAWATGYNVIAIPLAAGVAWPWGALLSPALGAALMSTSAIIVAVNAMRLERSAIGYLAALRVDIAWPGRRMNIQ